MSANGLRTDPRKVEAIKEMKPPTDVKGIKHLIGVLGYYRTLMPDFAEHSCVLTKLTKIIQVLDGGLNNNKPGNFLKMN